MRCSKSQLLTQLRDMGQPEFMRKMDLEAVSTMLEGMQRPEPCLENVEMVHSVLLLDEFNTLAADAEAAGRAELPEQVIQTLATWMRGAQDGVQVRWVVLAGSGISTFRSALSSFEQKAYTLSALDEAVRTELVKREMERKGFLPAEAQNIVDNSAVQALIHFTIGLPGPLAIVLRQMLVHEGLRELRDLDRLQDRIKADMASIVQGTDDIHLPSNMDLAMAVLMMLSGLVFSQSTRLSSGMTLREFMTRSAVLAPQSIGQRDLRTLLMAPQWATYLATSLITQGLSEETNIALNATIRALDLDVRQPVQGLPMEELVTAGLLSKFLLCSKQGIIQPASGAWTLGQLYPDAVASSVLLSKAVDVVPLRLVRDVNPLFKSRSGDLVLPRRGTIPVVRETAKSTVQESIDWRDPKHMVLMKRYEADNAPYADLRLWADVYTAGQPEPKRTLFLHQIKAEGTEGASNVQTLLDTFDTVKASIDRFNAGVRDRSKFDLVFVHMTTARYTEVAHGKVLGRSGLMLLDRSNLNVWCSPMHKAQSLWKLDLRRKRPVKAAWRPLCPAAAVHSARGPMRCL